MAAQDAAPARAFGDGMAAGVDHDLVSGAAGDVAEPPELVVVEPPAGRAFVSQAVRRVVGKFIVAGDGGDVARAALIAIT